MDAMICQIEYLLDQTRREVESLVALTSDQRIALALIFERLADAIETRLADNSGSEAR